MPGYCTFLGHFLDELGLERVTLVGTSLGGAVTPVTPQPHNPLRVARLILLAAWGLLHWAKRPAGVSPRPPTTRTFAAVDEKLVASHFRFQPRNG